MLVSKVVLNRTHGNNPDTDTNASSNTATTIANSSGPLLVHRRERTNGQLDVLERLGELAFGLAHLPHGLVHFAD